jgi:hypothetical protein
VVEKVVSHKICVVVFVLARFEDDSKDSGRERAGIYAEPAAAEPSSLLFK